MSCPLISVVIPHLNQPDHLRRCLESLATQRFELSRVEIIVVDNGSKHPPADICAEFDGVRLVEELTPGPGPARNLGVKLSRGALVAFVDADCTADPGWLAAIKAELTGAGDTKVIGGNVRIARRNSQRATMLEAYESIYAYRQEEYITRHGFSGTGNLAMHRHVYDTVGPFCGIDRAEDRDWGQRATHMGFVIRYVPEMTVYHPARQSFDELCAKWDRHISHDFELYARGYLGRMRWLGLSAAVAVSPLFELYRIATSQRVSTTRERTLAAVALLKIRLYRAGRMLAALVDGTTGRSSRKWNRT